MKNNNLSKLLNGAISMEEKGYKFYKKAAKESENEITRNTFNFLANNETLHIENIKNFYNSLQEKGEFPETNLEDIKNKRLKELTIFTKTIKELKEKIKPSDNDKKACEFAMELENSGYKYYEDMLKSAKDEKLKKLLKFLLEEESQHYEGIRNLYTYLTDTHNWYMYEEGSFPQGG